MPPIIRSCELDLLVGHLVELRDGDLDGILELAEIRGVSGLIPLEEARIVDEVLDQEILGVGGEDRGVLDLVERSDRGAEDVADE